MTDRLHFYAGDRVEQRKWLERLARLRKDMAFFDRLPPDLRRETRNTCCSWSAEAAHTHSTRWRDSGMAEAEITARVRQAWRDLDAQALEIVRTSWPRGKGVYPHAAAGVPVLYTEDR